MDLRTSIKTRFPDWLYSGLVSVRDARALRRRRRLSPEGYSEELVRLYRKRVHRNFNLDDPQSFNEKIQWLKLYDSSAEKGRLADKYRVREWVDETIGDGHLVPLLGVWDNPDDINLDELPNQFVLKATHASGWNIIVTDKSKLNWSKTLKKLRYWVSTDFSMTKPTLELHYGFCERRIIAEEFMDFGGEGPVDYRFFCSWGKVFSVWEDSCSGTLQHKRNIYSPDWVLLPVRATWPCLGKRVKPACFEEMLDYAKRLGKEFSFVRIDFYEYEGKVMFGEMTFTPMAGYALFDPKEFDLELGQHVILPETKIEPGHSRN